MISSTKLLVKSLLLSLIVLLAVNTQETQAQNTVGGHFGFVQPIVTLADGEINDHFDPYTIGFPIGLTVRKNEKFAFDAEFVPFISANGNSDDISFLVHPGFLWGIGDKLTFGARAAYEIGGGRYGVTPLLNKGFSFGDTPVFAEFVLPVRWGSGGPFALSAALHFGVGF